MADFRKVLYALAIVALFVGFTSSASAQNLTCLSLTATNQQVRVEGDAELVGDVVLGCSGSGFTTPANTLVQAADITVSIPSAIITSQIINPGATSPISEATLIIDDLKDQTCTPTAGLNTAASIYGGPCSLESVQPGNTSGAYYPGSRPHRICSDTTNPGGLGVCQIFAKASGPQDTYDGSSGHPNIFVAQPNGTGAVIFRGVPLDPPATGFTRFLRFTNIRVNAAATGLAAGNPLSQISAIISFQGPASIGLATIQTTVATVLTGNGGTTATEDTTYLQCDYPVNTLLTPPEPAIAESPGCTGSSSSSTSTSGTGGGESSGTPGSNLGHGYCTNTGATPTITVFPGDPVHPVIKFKEGFQTAWKTRNMSEVLGASGEVVVQPGQCGIGAVWGVPCSDGTGNGFNAPNEFTYNGSSTPNPVATDIAQNSPQIRYFTEDGFTETPSTAVETTPAGFSYFGTPGSSSTPGAGVASQGTRLQATISNIPANAVVSIPTVVWLFNGKINSGVMILVNTSANGAGALSPVAPASALASLQDGNINTPLGLGCTGNVPTNTTGPQVACDGYFDLTGPTATFTYEIIFSDPYSTEAATIYPIVYYPAAALTSKPTTPPQANVVSTVSPYTFAPWIAQPGGNQVSSPLGQLAGTPRFVQTTGAALPLFVVDKCTCSLLFPWVVSDNNYVTGIAVANTSSDPTNALSIPGYTAVQQSGTVNLYLFGTIAGKTAQTNSSIAAVYPGTDTQALSGSYATFIVNTGFDGYAITQANFQYCHGLAFLFNSNNAVPPVSYLGLVLDPGGLSRTAQAIGDSLGQ